MAFTENLESIQRELKSNGFATMRDPFDLSTLAKEEAVVDCEIIANKSFYNILYIEVESNWKGIATDVAKNSRNPCLVVTNYKHTRLILTTLRDHITERTPRHVVVDSKSKTHSFQKFCKLIKVKHGDEIEDIDAKIQSAFDEYSEYAEALREFANNLDVIIKKTTRLIESKISGNKRYEKEATKLLTVCQKILNDQMTIHDIKNMLIQHVLTYKIFALVYDEQDFNHNNTVAKSLEVLKETLELGDEKIDYGAMEIISESITDTDQKQEFLKKIYETFYEKHDAKKADRDGIVYTPTEVVKFIVLSINELLRENFGKDISDDDVMILDPFTGTGTFLVHLLREIDPKKLKSKYSKEIFANEISILPYYIAALNIENTYTELTGKYKEFENICWMDTFDSGIKKYDDIAEHLGLADNIKRITKQQKSKIHVVLGNPPYSVGQRSSVDQNPNQKYPVLDEKIKNSYLKRTIVLNKDISSTRSLYDSYIRSLRWATDRIDDLGIIGFITNASFLRSQAAAGVRASLHEEFTDIYCFDLRGNQRTQGEISKKEGGKIFGSGSRAPVAITILVKNPNKKKHTIHYKDIGDYLSREEKLDTISKYKSIQHIKDWDTITPDKHHDWVGQRSDEFEQYTAMGNKETKAGNKSNAIFKMFSMGVKTARDIWMYNSSKNLLTKNIKKTIGYCNGHDLKTSIHDPKYVKWDTDLSKKLKKTNIKFNSNQIRMAVYRPFFKQYLYFDQKIVNRVFKISKIFPNHNSKNVVILVPYHNGGLPTAFISDITPDYSIVPPNQCFSLYMYENGQKIINITDYILKQYQDHYNDKTITKEDIFYYTYGVLHHEKYKKKFASNLSKELPRIPMAPNFQAFTTAGRKLADLHLNYETCKKYPLKQKAKFGKLEKMMFVKTKKDGKLIQDKTRLKINGIEVFDLPEIKYTVNGRTPIEWIVDRYKRTVDKDSGIVNDPTKGMTEEKTIEMIQRLVHVSVESDKIIQEISEEPFEPKVWKPAPSGLDQYAKDSS